jgi:hypothetical protein
MRAPSKPILGLALVLTLALSGGGMAAAASNTTEARPDEFQGNLVNTLRGVRHDQTFTLSVDRYATPDELNRLADTVATKGAFTARDQLWKDTSGYLSIGGGLGYPISAVTSQETPTGRMIRVVVNRPMSLFETQYYTHSSKYPFTVVELNLDRNGHGDGRLIAAAKLQVHNGELAFESFGVQPLVLMDVQEHR